MPYDLNALRNNIRKISGKFSDPDEFRPDKAKSATDPIKYRFFVLPPLQAGEVLKSGEVTNSMDNFFVRHGNHWVNDRPHPCPRIHDGSECPICQYGFDLLRECKDKKYSDERKQQILKQWMPSTYYMVNIFFTNWKGNPEDLRGKVKFYNAPKTCVDKWTAALLRDDAGDEEDPDAFGVFFDENSAFGFELVVLKEGRTNGYKTSSFIKNGGVPTPMITNPDGTPNRKALDLLLKSRIDLFAKIEKPDVSKLSRLAETMINGDDAEDDRSSGGGFDSDEENDSLLSAMEQSKKPSVNTGKAVAESKTPKPQKTTQAFSQSKKNVPDSDEGDAEESVSQSSDDVGSDEIDDLLSQLED